MVEQDKMNKITALAKRRGFLYSGSEIYRGLAGTFDYGPLGVALKDNIKRLWWQRFVEDREDIYGLDAAILMRPEVWQASGHASGFSDPLVNCKSCGYPFRADHLEENTCPECGGELTSQEQFNMMLETQMGAADDSSSKTYLRPETAQGIFTNFKNVVDSFSPKLPFGIAQIGKAFRNEIAPRNFLFRTREFEQMEVEYFVKESEWEGEYEKWVEAMRQWNELIGLSSEQVHEVEQTGDELAHYSKRTIDFEYDYPFGQKELFGLAYRTDYDLKNHMDQSGEDLRYFDQDSGEKFLPHVIEPSLGLDRVILALLCDAYTEEKVDDGESRVFLKFAPKVAPMQMAVFPLLKNKPELVEKARQVHKHLQSEFGRVGWDDHGNIGKRYRRQDEIGTPLCITVDFDSLEDEAVTVRDRDTTAQERVKLDELSAYLNEKFAS